MKKEHVNVKEKIRNTLLELSSEMSIEKINVATLVKRCEISRTLFYYYYEDMYALLEDILSTDMEKVMNDCIKISDPYESVSYFVYCCTGHFTMLKKLSGTKYYEDAERMIRMLAEKYLRKVFDSKVDVPMKQADVNFMLEFMAAGITSYFFAHCDDAKFDIESASRQILSIISKCTGMEL